MAIRNEVIDDLLAGKDPQAVFSQDGLLDELKKALAERILKGLSEISCGDGHDGTKGEP